MGYKNIKFPKGSQFLITGAAGFIGSNLVEAILRLGYQVRGLDDFSTGRKQNVDEFIDNPKYEFVEGSICDYNTCVNVVEGMDYVIHQAAWGAIPRSIKRPLEYDTINVHGTLNMMQACVKNGDIKKFVYASSSSVYGDEKALPKVEGREGKLLAPYPITKAVNELYAKNYYELYGLETVGLRYFNVFGRRQNPDSTYAAVIPKFVKSLINNEPAIINGDGSYSRDFTYIENVIEANLKACLAGKKVAGEVFNIAYGENNTIGHLYKVIAKLLDKDIEPIYGPIRSGDIPHSLADISKARKLLNYNPSYNFDEGIRLAVDWYKTNIKFCIN